MKNYKRQRNKKSNSIGLKMHGNNYMQSDKAYTIQLSINSCRFSTYFSSLILLFLLLIIIITILCFPLDTINYLTIGF